MKSGSAKAAGSSDSSSGSPAQAATRHFMITLCRLSSPVPIPPIQSRQLKRFTFFRSWVHQPDGSERLYLHMGYFETLAEAERWVFVLRRRYPGAFATTAPRVLLPPTQSAAPSISAPASQPPVPESGDRDARVDEALTDTQALKILEARRSPGVENDGDARECDQIPLLRPDDTTTLRALNAAAVHDAPISFAVQLHWSAQPIDLSHLRSLPAFRSHTLYATESRRDGKSRYFLRLGFFSDPMSAKRVAAQVRSSFAAAAVVPVAEQEIARAHEAGLGSFTIPNLLEQPLDREIDPGDAAGLPRQAEPLTAATRGAAQGAEALVKGTKPLTDTELWTPRDTLSESGVRHLRIEVQEQSSGRWRAIRLNPKASNAAQADL